MSKRGRNGRGQAVVEMLLVLPAFFGIIFVIMEFGNIAFQTVLLNHATWEAARIGAMTATPPGGGSPAPKVSQMQGILTRVILSATIVSARAEPTVFDNQAGIQNNDLVLKTRYPIPLIFPISNFFLSRPIGSGTREVQVEVRMPIERPLPK